MKRLVIALQRIGDILMLVPTLRAIKAANPSDELHILIHRECEGVAPLLDTVDIFHYFERGEWQKSVGDLRLSGFEAFSQLKELVQNLTDSNYIQVLNLSHNKLSAQLTGLIAKQSYNGVKQDAWGGTQFSSSWFEELDQISSLNRWEKYHFADYMFFGAGFSSYHQKDNSAKSTTTNGIAIQVFTSDIKKNLSLTQWEQFIETLIRVRPDTTVTLLAAPFERPKIESWFTGLQKRLLNVSLLSLDLKGTAEFLRTQKLLVTGDTSIKHLAALNDVPVLEIALGSSELEFTGALSEQAIIVKPKAACFPCPVRENCSQTEHRCAGEIDPHALVMVATQLMEGLTQQLKTVAEEYRQSFTLIRPFRTKDGIWHPIPVAERFSMESVDTWVKRSFKTVQLTSARSENIASYAELLRRLYPFASKNDWHQIFKDIVFPKDKDFIKKELIQCLKLSS